MIFVCGTDTAVGKTHASAAILYRYRHSPGVRYWKPVQTGTRTDTPDAETVRSLTGLPDSHFLQTLHSFGEPLSPHRAAELEGQTIDVDALAARVRETAGPTIVEGAGGLLVPLNRSSTWLDFLKLCPMPVVIAARTALGTINHSLLTIHRLKSAGVAIAGIVFCGPDNPDNVKTIIEMGGVPLLGSFEYRDRSDFEGVDPHSLLAAYL